MASPHTLNTVTIDGDYVPASGTLIKLLLGNILDGSLASLTSDSRSIRSTSSSPTHSALVLGAVYVPTMMHGLCLAVRCLPIPSYHREEDAVEGIRQRPETHRFLPFPATEKVDTPAGFGEPISVKGYVNDRPCWVLMRQHTVLLAIGKKVKFSASPESLSLFTEFCLRSRSSIPPSGSAVLRLFASPTMGTSSTLQSLSKKSKERVCYSKEG